MRRNCYNDEAIFCSEIAKYVSDEHHFYCMPGHKQGRGAPKVLKELWGEKIFKYDLTEVRGSDVLAYPKKGLLRSQLNASQLFGAAKSWFLVNGASVGLYAVMTAILNSQDKVIVHRDCHKSVITGLIMSGCWPIFLNRVKEVPEYAYGGVNLAELKENIGREKPKALVITSPNYYGLCLDIEQIASVCRQQSVALIVDEAHGTHFAFSDELPEHALRAGSDYVIHSVHKTIGGLYQTGMLHTGKKQSEVHDRIAFTLALFQSTSPSVPLLMSIDSALHNYAQIGRQKLSLLLKILDKARRELTSPLCEAVIPTPQTMSIGTFAGFDKTKLIFRINSEKCDPLKVKQALSQRYGIEVELASLQHLLLTFTIADVDDTKKTIEELLAFFKILTSLIDDPQCRKTGNLLRYSLEKVENVQVTTPRAAFFAPGKWVRLDEALGKVSKSLVYLYPPGSPFLVPGERITEGTITLLLALRSCGATPTGVKTIGRNIYIEITGPIEKQDA